MFKYFFLKACFAFILTGNIGISIASNITTDLNPISRSVRVDLDNDGLYFDNDFHFPALLSGSFVPNNEIIGPATETFSGRFHTGESRVVYEFDLNNFLSNPASILSVILNLDFRGGGTSNGFYPSVDLYGFSGNGNAFDESDYSNGALLLNLTPSSTNIADYFHSVDLSNYVQTLTTDYLGINLRVTSYDDNSGNQVQYTPSLSITSVPIPSAIWLFGCALLGLISKQESKLLWWQS